MKQYTINEIFYSIQGEGMRMGTPNVFVRFTGCNMRCEMDEGPKSPGGFDCDTEFESGRKMTAKQISDAGSELLIENNAGKWPNDEPWIILTGGEPALQADQDFVFEMHERGWKLAIETNGSKEANRSIDWITVSPKVAEHAIKQKFAHEVKYVRGYGQAVPKTVVRAEHYLLSPAFNGMVIDTKALEWCVELVKGNPTWRLSPQMHKAWVVR